MAIVGRSEGIGVGGPSGPIRGALAILNESFVLGPGNTWQQSAGQPQWITVFDTDNFLDLFDELVVPAGLGGLYECAGSISFTVDGALSGGTNSKDFACLFFLGTGQEAYIQPLQTLTNMNEGSVGAIWSSHARVTTNLREGWVIQGLMISDFSSGSITLLPGGLTYISFTYLGGS